MSRRSASLLLFLTLALPAVAQINEDEQTGMVANGAESAETAMATASPPQPPAQAAPGRSELKPMIERTAKRHGVEAALVNAVIAAESAYDAHAVSPAGAIGLMQLMPATAADYGTRDVNTLFDPEVNLKTGVRHLKRLLSKYKNDYGRVIMAYNAGEGVVDRTNSNVTYDETLAYTETVIKQYRRNGGTQPTEQALRKVRLLRSMKNRGKATHLMAQYLDLSLPQLKARHIRSIRIIDRGLDSKGPRSRPMIVLESRKKD